MNRWILATIVAGLVLLASVYIFIPTKLVVSKNVIINCTINGANRFLLDEHKWIKWWPGDLARFQDSSFQKKRFNYKGYTFLADLFSYNRIFIIASDDKIQLSTVLNILPLNRDSIVTQWQCTLTSSMNPIKRIIQYQEARNIKATMTEILFGLQSFLEKRSNIYGIDIKEIISQDSTLLATKLITVGYPNTSEIYGLIKKLRSDIANQKALETNYPMLNIKKLNNTGFETMVAIPVNRKLDGAGSIFASRFVPWKTLTADVKGGNWTIEQARQQMKIYIQDHNRTPYAIPFESLITDRSVETDTLKWVSRVCQAVS